MKFQYDEEGPFTEHTLGATLLYKLEWAEWLAAQGQSAIAASSWEADAGITVAAPGADADTTQALISVPEEAAVGAVFWVTNTVTAGALVKPAPFRVKVVRK